MPCFHRSCSLLISLIWGCQIKRPGFRMLFPRFPGLAELLTDSPSFLWGQRLLPVPTSSGHVPSPNPDHDRLYSSLYRPLWGTCGTPHRYVYTQPHWLRRRPLSGASSVTVLMTQRSPPLSFKCVEGPMDFSPAVKAIELAHVADVPSI